MKKIIFVADFFLKDYRGGAELTTQALIERCHKSYITKTIKSNELTDAFIINNKDAKFIVCNFSYMTEEIKLLFCKLCDYQIIEYDYKFCKFRSLDKHKIIEKNECNCLEFKESKINKIFYGYSKKIWFMSKKQKQIFLNYVTTIKEENCLILSSVFSCGDIRFIESIKDNQKNNNYIILDSNSWIKNTKGCIDFAKQNNLKYELIKNLPYHEMLIKLSTSKGLIFKPSGGDTCPRIVIEAKMLGCDLKLNENVQHKQEKWFLNQDECYKYMLTRADFFMENV